MTRAIENEEWLSSGPASRLFGITPTTLVRIAPAMQVRIRVLPGRVGRLYSKPDIIAALARLQAEEEERVATGQGAPGMAQQWGERARRETAHV